MSAATLLIQRYPWIAWTQPVHVLGPTGSVGYTCRICVGLLGLNLQDTDRFGPEPDVVQHIRDKHPETLPRNG